MLYTSCKSDCKSLALIIPAYIPVDLYNDCYRNWRSSQTVRAKALAVANDIGANPYVIRYKKINYQII